MKLYRFRGAESVTSEILEAGMHYLPVALDEVIFFVRPNHLVPCCKGADCVADLDESTLSLLGFVETEASYTLYHDDGFSREYDNPANFTTLTLSADGTKTASDDRITLL